MSIFNKKRIKITDGRFEILASRVSLAFAARTWSSELRKNNLSKESSGPGREGEEGEEKGEFSTPLKTIKKH